MLASLLKMSAPPFVPSRPPGEFVKVDGIVLHVVREGPRDGPAVVMCSGLGGAWLSWDGVVPLLAEHCQVVRFDRPGLGWSAPDRRTPTASGEAHRIRELMWTLSIPGPFVLVGHSLGGLFAEAFARLYPQLTSGIVLTESACEPTSGFARHRRLKVRVARACGALAQSIGASQLLGPGLRELGVRTQSRRGVDISDPDQAHGAFCHGATVTAAMVERATCYDMAAEVELMRRLRPMPELPIYVLSATGPRNDARSVHHWRRHQRNLASLLSAEHREVPDSAHLMPIDRPDAIARAILDAVQRGVE